MMETLGSARAQDLRQTTGTVKFFDFDKGFGFITPDDGRKDVFVHVAALDPAGLTTLAEGQRVTFDVADRPFAVKLDLAGDDVPELTGTVRTQRL